MSSPWSSLRYSPFAHLTLAGSPCPATTEFLIFLLGLTGSIFPFLVSALSSNVVGLFTVPGGRRSAQHAGRPRKVPVRGSHSTWRVRKTVDGPVISIDSGFWGWGLLNDCRNGESSRGTLWVFFKVDIGGKKPERGGDGKVGRGWKGNEWRRQGGWGGGGTDGGGEER